MGLGKVLTAVTDFVGGGLFKEIKEAFIAYLPPDTTPLQKAEINIKLSELLGAKQAEANRVIADASTQLNARIAEQEGTASDLKVLGIIGKPIIFLRGMQRPLWGYATLWMDFRWFFETHSLSDQQNTALIIINVLVLGFLFGERTVLNLQPLIEKVFSRN